MHGTYLLPASAGNWIDPDLSRLPRLSFGRCRRLLLRACSRVGCTLYNVLMLVVVAFRHNSNIVLEGTPQASMHCTECKLITTRGICHSTARVSQSESRMAVFQRSPRWRGEQD